jgi:monoterpene epsilon-lactone hydrolase
VRSFRSQIVELILPLTGIKRSLRSEAAIRKQVARARKKGPALPSNRMRRRFSVTETAINESRVFAVAPRPVASRGHILYLHGGTYVNDVIAWQWRMVERLVARTACTAVVPLYPLAPEYIWRDAFGVVTPLYEALVAQVGAENLIVLGDSAGGGMALSLAQQLRNAGRPLPSKLVLIAPWLDVTCSDPRQPELAKRDRMLDIPGIRAAGRWYAGDLAPTAPEISPLFGSLSGLPPMAVWIGKRDLLHADAQRLKAQAEREGARLTYYEYDGMFHDWPMAPILEAERAIDEMAAFIQAGK